MKQINFSEKRILKALLNKTKVTFIEKAWEPTVHYWRTCPDCDKRASSKYMKNVIVNLMELLMTNHANTK